MKGKKGCLFGSYLLIERITNFHKHFGIQTAQAVVTEQSLIGSKGFF